MIFSPGVTIVADVLDLIALALLMMSRVSVLVSVTPSVCMILLRNVSVV